MHLSVDYGKAFFQTISHSSCMNDKEKMSLEKFAEIVITDYRRKNSYQLLNHIQSTAYHNSSSAGTNMDPFPKKIKPLLTSGEKGLPDYKAIKKLQKNFKAFNIDFYYLRKDGHANLE